jgi:hypothetical protein
VDAVTGPPCDFRAEWHRPRFYRYLVADRRFRLVRNRYDSAWIGLALVAGRYAYCVKWADARTVMR